MDAADIEFQAEKCREFMRRGGSMKTWMQSKGFRPEDRIEIAKGARDVRKGL